MINKINPNIIDNLNISVVLPTFLKSKKDRDNEYRLNSIKGIAINPYQILKKMESQLS